MAFTLRVRLNRKGVRQVLRSDGMGDEMERRAKAVARQAQGSAPAVTGAYKNSIVAYRHMNPSRVVGRAEATVPYGAKIEAKYRVLGRAIDAAGG